MTAAEWGGLQSIVRIVRIVSRQRGRPDQTGKWLSEEEVRVYRDDRNRLLQRVGERMGGNVIVVE